MLRVLSVVSMSMCVLASCGTPSSDPELVRRDSLEAIRHVSGNFHGLSPFGKPEHGAVYDPIANALANRDIAPDHYTPMALDDLLTRKDESSLANASVPRDQWPTDQLNRISTIEESGRYVIGNLAEAVVNDPEGVNSFSKDYRTIHLLLTRSPGESKMDAMEADINPRLLEQHPSWNAILGRTGSQVRVSGWPFLDARHQSWIGEGRRGTLWKISPVTKLEVMDSTGKWREM